MYVAVYFAGWERISLFNPIKVNKGTAPVFAELLCRKGELHPPGFLMNYFWSDWDMENGLKISCEIPDEVPEPGVKRGMAIWNSGQQAEFVKTYNLPSKHPSNFTIGWISFWSLNQGSKYRSKSDCEAKRKRKFFREKLRYFDLKLIQQ